jgi:hypothetical protein
MGDKMIPLEDRKDLTDDEITIIEAETKRLVEEYKVDERWIMGALISAYLGGRDSSYIEIRYCVGDKSEKLDETVDEIYKSRTYMHHNSSEK